MVVVSNSPLNSFWLVALSGMVDFSRIRNILSYDSVVVITQFTPFIYHRGGHGGHKPQPEYSFLQPKRLVK